MRKLVACLVFTLVGGVAYAQPAPKGGEKAGPPPASGSPKTKTYDFSGDTIEGDLIKPEGTGLDARDFAKHSSLIKIRKDFIEQIIKSAEDL